MTTDAQRLAAAFRGGGPVEALQNKPSTVAEGYDLQDEVREAMDRIETGVAALSAQTRRQKSA